MRFKRLREFNLALLAKQGWRILANPLSLVSRILKARYFPSVNFLDAPLGHNPSYIWRSIRASQDLLRKGVMRRVSDGKDTAVWGQPWLLDITNPCLLTHEIEELKDARVSNLLDGNGRWDEELIRDIFYPQDVPRILATPVSPEYEDSWCCKVPPKICNFMWRCVMNVLPVRENLRSKRVFVGGGCPLCSVDMETITHILCECPVAMCLWDCTDILQGKTFVHFVESVYEKPDAHDAVLMATRFWTCWLARNDKVWHGKTWSSSTLKERVTQLVIQWQRDVHVNTATNQSSNPPPATWSPPPNGLLKCNVDATVAENF
ncbi:PREDICTED: uncharacterized protein LOC109167528 [Ipomoea nil]|uniref:uncharacterized protein LOC109167528 n=1 Tax=Ipomoea nil TaxID=35883 RepID=UPI00090125E1|nr:PREDICTED: uncharacterized protein LOC109167528 [Ipomoea nil]